MAVPFCAEATGKAGTAMKKEDLYLLAAFPGFSNRQKAEIIGKAEEWEFPQEGIPDFWALPWVTEKHRRQWKEYTAEASRMREQFAAMTEKEISFLALPEAGYPVLLKQIYDPPFALYYKGRLPLAELPAVAVIGARACSAYGKGMAESFAGELAASGISIISGMAYGIDAAAHRGALRAGGYTMAVLGNGVDICYPKEHYYLYEHIVQTGGILSEFPPGTAPLPRHFPQRNRIISGLAQCVLVMEAKARSGSLITVEHALEQGKDVFALPGRIGDELSEGCNRLIQNGAQLLREPKEIVQFLQNFCEFSVKEIKKVNQGLADNEKLVYSCLDLEPKHIQSVLEETGLSLPALAMILVSMEQKGIVAKYSEGYFALRARKDR